MGTNKVPAYSLRIPKDLLDRVKYMADYNCRTANREIENILGEAVEKFEDDVEIITPEKIAEMYERKNRKG